MSLIVATRNAGKLKEIRSLLTFRGLEVLGLEAFAELPEVVEDGKTFRENALKKACEIAQLTGTNVLADDSGLEVDTLDGAPGVHSARYAGDDADDEANNRKLLEAMRDMDPSRRRARFRCVMALVTRAGQVYATSGTVEGEILAAPVGDGGFGYDPLFWLPDRERTMAQLSTVEKNRISHRARALRLMLPYLKAL